MKLLAGLLLLSVVACTYAQEFVEITVFEGEMIRMDCNMKEMPGLDYKYTWLKDSGTPVSYDKVYKMDVATLEHTGLYYCTTLPIMNKNIELPTSQIIYSVQVKPLAQSLPNADPEIIITGLEPEYDTNGLLLLQCQVTRVQDPSRFLVVWKFPDGTLMSQATLYESPITRFGRYQCVITDRNTGIEYTKDVDVINRNPVVPSPNDNANLVAQNYQISLRVDPQPLQLNTRTLMKCVVSPSQPPSSTLILYRDGQPIAYNGEFETPSLTEEDVLSTYKCELIVNGNQFGSYDVNAVAVTETKETQMTSAGVSIGVNSGDTIELHCEVEFGTARQVTWAIAGRPVTLPYQNIRASYTNELAALALTSITPENQGKYECRTITGEVKFAILKVYSKQIELEINPVYRSVNEGASMELHCSVPTSQLIRSGDLEWFYLGPDRNGREGPYNGGWSIKTYPDLPQSLFLEKRGIIVSDAGFYLCRHKSRSEIRGIAELVVIGATRVITLVMEPRRYEARADVYVSVSFTCNAYDNGAPYNTNVQWRFTDGRPLEYDNRFRIQGNSLTFSGQFSRADVGEIQFQCYVRTDRSEVVDNGVITITGGGCDPTYQYTCSDGTCIDNSRRCNGIRDCSDGSDEDPQYCAGCDPVEKKCEFYNGRAPSKPMYAVHWQCDGEDDCGNGYDERDCRNIGATCGGTQYRCTRNFPEKIIPFAFLCDSEYDCEGGDDENVCQGAPTIVRTEPLQEITTRLGDTVVLRCDAEGFPVPRVIWRYNWRCLPDTNRMITENNYDGSASSCRSARSSLTIRNVRATDAGLYNCEALSGNKRAMSQAIVLIISG